jgi:bifunctional DNA-binding transcriptional regulator/antitoxin component of YhaV-PrlF toxin-antitoxin module
MIAGRDCLQSGRQRAFDKRGDRRSSRHQAGVFYSSYSYDFLIDGKIVMRAKDSAKLSAKYQISIPKSVRAARRWQAGQVFAFIPKGEGLLLVSVPERDELSGLARSAKRSVYRDRNDRV